MEVPGGGGERAGVGEGQPPLQTILPQILPVSSAHGCKFTMVAQSRRPCFSVLLLILLTVSCCVVFGSTMQLRSGSALLAAPSRLIFGLDGESWRNDSSLSDLSSSTPESPSEAPTSTNPCTHTNVSCGRMHILCVGRCVHHDVCVCVGSDGPCAVCMLGD